MSHEVTLVGAGAVGCTLAAALAEARKSLCIYTRPKDRSAFEAARTLVLEQPGKPILRLPAPPLSDALFDTDTRLVLIATKFSALDGLCDAMAQLPASVTLVSTLNGVKALPLLRQRFPQHRVAGLTIMFNTQHLGPLHARLTTRPQVIAGRDDTDLRELLAGTRLRVRHGASDAATWGKLLINLSNALGALTHSTFRDLLSQPDLRACMVAVLDEAVDRLDAAGIAYALPMPLPYRGYRTLLRRGGPLAWWLARANNGLDDGAYPSMVADVRSGRPTEVRQLNGEIAALGQRLDWPAPRNQWLVEAVQAIRDPTRPAFTPAQLRAHLAA
jgi:2-dehydropantoate 2-reductase